MKKFGILIMALYLFLGCAGRLMDLHLGMTKSDVVSKIGKPVSARGSITNKHGQVVEVWEYWFYKGPQPADYWLYFVENKLVQWGEAGDWQKEADRIYEIKFGREKYLPK